MFTALNIQIAAEGVNQLLTKLQLDQVSTELAKSGNLKLVAIGAVFVGILMLFFLLRWAFSSGKPVVQNTDEMSHRISTLETLLTDHKAKNAEHLTKLQGEILRLRHELAALKETLQIASSDPIAVNDHYSIEG